MYLNWTMNTKLVFVTYVTKLCPSVLGGKLFAAQNKWSGNFNGEVNTYMVQWNYCIAVFKSPVGALFPHSPWPPNQNDRQAKSHLT